MPPTKATKEEPKEDETAAPTSLSEALDMLPGSVMQREANEAATKEAEKAAKEAEREAAKAERDAAKQAEDDDDAPTEVSSTDKQPVNE